MGKNSIADNIEIKIRQMSEKYRQIKKCSSENIILKPTYSSLIQERTSELIRKDLKLHLPIVKLLSSHDVSHLKDSKTSKPNAYTFNLPKDIEELKKLIDFKSNNIENFAYSCTKSACIDRFSAKVPEVEEKTLEFLEKFDHGLPSNRKEIENLLNWYIEMKNKHENDKDFDVIVFSCGQELVKQVYVECKARGNLLKMILSSYHLLFTKKKETLEEKLKISIAEYEKSLENIKKNYKNNLSKYETKIYELESLQNKNKEIIYQKNQELELYKKKLHDLQRIYLEEQDMWRKQYIQTIDIATKKGMIMSNGPYKLAVAKWKRNEVHVDPLDLDMDVSSEIQNKILNGELLDPKELEDYLETRQKNDKSPQATFNHIETQTDYVLLVYPEEAINPEPIPSPFDPKSEGLTENRQLKITLCQSTQTEKLEYNEDELIDILSLENSEQSIKNIKENANNSDRSYDSYDNPDGKIYEYGDNQDLVYIPNKDELGVVDEFRSEFERSDFNGEFLDRGNLENYEKNVSVSKIEYEYQPDLSYRDDHQDYSLSKGNSIAIENHALEDDQEFELNPASNSLLAGSEENNVDTDAYDPKEINILNIKQNPQGLPKKNTNKGSKNPGTTDKSRGFSNKTSKTQKQSDKKDAKNIKKNTQAQNIDSGSFENESLDKKPTNIKSNNKETIEINPNDYVPDTKITKNLRSSNKELTENSPNDYMPDNKETKNTYKGDGRLLKKNSNTRETDEKKLENYNKRRLNTLQDSDGSKNTNLNIEENKESTSLHAKASSEVLKDMLQGKMGKDIKKTAASLSRAIQLKKKELEDLEKQIEYKRKLLEGYENTESHQKNSKTLKKPQNDSKLSLDQDLEVQETTENSESTSKNPNMDKIQEKTRSNNILSTKSSVNKSKSSTSKKLEVFSQVPTPINEMEEEEEKNETDSQLPANHNSISWKKGYDTGYARGKAKGIVHGKILGKEEGIMEGYAQAVKELNQQDSLSEDPELDVNRENESLEVVNTQNAQPKNKRKFSVLPEIKSTKELTKFAEFKFSRQKAQAVKVTNPAFDLVKKLLKKSNDNVLKKATASRKMVNKMLSNLYQICISKASSEEVDELLAICYDEFFQKYGLKKVADRKFLEFIASLIKNKTYKKCFMFMRLAGLGNLNKVENYSKFTFLMYLDSLHYMLVSKIGITMNYDETDDKPMFPINRAVECVKEKLDNKADKILIQSIVSNLEHKAMPDPQRISTGLIDLEYTLECICEAYESVQSKIKKGVETVLRALGYEENKPVLQYDFSLCVRYINPSKFQRLEGDDILEQVLTHEEAYELCVDLNIMNETDVHNFAKNYTKKPFDNYTEMLDIIEKMEKAKTVWVSISEDQWRERLNECIKKWDETNIFGIIAWRIYESELKRISNEYL